MPSTPLVCFSHGKESGPWGTKIAAMADLARDRGLEVDSIDYRGMDDPAARVEKLVRAARRWPGRWCWSAPAWAARGGRRLDALPDVRGLFLIAPAFYMPGLREFTPSPQARRITIVHGWRDDVVPAANSIRFAARTVPACT
jgi:hypothetical protein